MKYYVRFTLLLATKALTENRGITLIFSMDLGTLDGGGWSTPRPGRLYPGKDPIPIVQETWMKY